MHHVSFRDNPLWHRFFAGVIVVAAAFVSWLGFFRPKAMDEKFTWAAIPPLHARFIGALYLFGAVYVLGAAVSRHRARWWPAMSGIFLFTSMMLVLTVLNWKAFDTDLGPVKVWVASYVIYPPIALVLAVAMRWNPGRPSGPTVLRPWVRSSLTAICIGFAVIGALLLFARGVMADVWPWKVSTGVAQFYGGPFLTIAWVCGAHARTARAEEDLTYLQAGLLCFAGASIVWSVHHRALFDFADLAAWAWFGGLGLVGLAATAGLATRQLARGRGAMAAGAVA